MGNLGDLGFSSFAAIGGAKEQHSSKATADDLSQYFRFEDGKWREATEGERISWCRDSIRAGLVTEMSGIKTYMDAMEIGGAAVASLPAILAAGSLEVGGAALVYGEGALTSIASTSGTVAGYSVSLGDALTIGGATWLLGTESGHEYVRQVGSSGLPTAQTAALVGVDAVAGMLSKGEAITTYVSEALDASAAKGADEFVNLASSQRTTHILTGDATGGGHLFPGGAGKSSFPQSWSADRVMHEISDVATDPLSSFVTGRGGRTVVNGTRDGIDLRVILGNPREGGGIITGFPTNVPRNP